MGAFRKKPPVTGPTRPEALAAVPVKSALVTEQRLESGDLLLIYPSVLRPWVAALARRLGRPDIRPAPRKLQLDSLGSFVWQMLDGRRSVRQIAETLAKDYQLHPREAEISVTRFLRSLGQRGLIGLR